MNVVFLGFDFFVDTFNYLVNNHHILKVYTFKCDNKYNYNTELIKICKSKNINISFENFNTTELEEINELGCEVLVSAGYIYKIPSLEFTNIKGINIHPELLPRGKGKWPMPWVILKELTSTGITIHKLDEDLDSGEILLQESFKLMKDESLETLSCKQRLLAKKLLETLFLDFTTYWNDSITQNIEKSEYWDLPSKEIRTLDYNKSTHELNKIIRAFGNFESFATISGKEYVIQNAIAWNEIHNYEIGKTILKDNKEILVSTKNGFICFRNYTRLD